jgi:CubicO group peptidase (beta-lactamase class C family)
LSKPVFAYAVLQLVDAGKLSLDTPLSTYVPNYVKDDPRAASVTVRHVLSQSSGLPNWHGKTTALKTYFLMPGDHPAFKRLDHSRNVRGALPDWFLARWHRGVC